MDNPIDQLKNEMFQVKQNLLTEEKDAAGGCLIACVGVLRRDARVGKKQ